MIGYFEALEHILQRYANTTICVERMLCHYDTYVHFFIGPLVFNFQSRKSTALSLERLFQGRIREEKKRIPAGRGNQNSLIYFRLSPFVTQMT